MKIVINSKSSGNYTTEQINGREHIVTNMVSIEADSVMNQIFYPAEPIEKSYHQLNNLLAPAGHPIIDGKFVSAFHPTAINAFNVGASIRNPQLVNGKVINELLIDVDVANRCDKGTELINRIKNSERIGVSTGLNAGLSDESGEYNGRKYTKIVNSMQFDHVAILLDEPPAGENTYVLNHDENVIVCNIADSVGMLLKEVTDAAAKLDIAFQYVEEVYFNPQRAILAVRKETENDEQFQMGYVSVPFEYDFAGKLVFTEEPTPVEKKEVYNQQQTEALKMDKDKLILAIIANRANNYTGEDKDKLMTLSEQELINAVCKPASFDDAKAIVESKGFFVNQITDEDSAAFTANKEAFTKWQTEQTNRLSDMAKTISNATQFSEAELLAMGEEGMIKINKLLNPEQDYSVQAASVTTANSDKTLTLHAEA